MASSDVSSVVSHFSNANEGFITTTSGSISSGAATIPLTSVSGLTNGDIFVGIIEPGLTKEQTFTGTVDTSGVQLTSVVWTRGSNAAHSAGVTIVDYVTGTSHNMMKKGLLVGHTQTGAHISSLPLTTPKITTSINDANGNEVIRTPATSSAVNDVTITNGATGVDPIISATGDDSTANLNLRGKGLAKTVTIGTAGLTIYRSDFVASGLVWTGDSLGSTRAASMTAGNVVINGKPITVAAVTAHTFTASKDTYVDVLDAGDGTGTVVYTEATNNAASSALASNSIRIAIIVTGASSIANAGSINQGSPAATLPTYTSTTSGSCIMSVSDSLGNLIYNTSPSARCLGIRQINGTSPTQTSGTNTAITGLSLPVQNTSSVARNFKISFSARDFSNNNAAKGALLQIWDGGTNNTFGSGTVVADTLTQGSGTGDISAVHRSIIVQVAANTTKTYGIGMSVTNGGGTATLETGSTTPAIIIVELV